MRKATAKRRGRGAGAASALALLLLALPACGILGRERNAVRVDPVETERIRREVEARLAAEPSIEVRRVRVEVLGTTVALHGAVDGLGALHCAIANAGLVRGVTGVADKLVLRPGPRDVRCLAPRVSPDGPPSGT
jgi:hypothetical protein